MERLMRRGIVFSLDAAIAITVVLILLINTAYYFSTASRESISQLQLIRTGSDIINIMDMSGDLRKTVINDYGRSPSMNPAISESEVNVSRYLPENYEMRVEIFDMGETAVNSNSAFDCVDGCLCTLRGCNGTFWVNTPSLEKSTNYPLRLNVTAYSNGSILLSIFNDFHISDKIPGPYDPFSGMFLSSPTGLHFDGGVNKLYFKVTNATVHWFTLLGAKEYAGQTQKPLPKMVNETFVGAGEKIMEALSTHPNMLKRIKRLSELG